MWQSLKDYTIRILKDKRGNFDLAQFFGLGKKSPDLSGVMDAPVQKGLTDFPTGEELNKRILAALQSGQGVGFDPRFVDRTTSPVIAQREARFKEQELPFLSSELSGRGLGRSTIAGESIRRASGQKERDINEVLGNAYFQDQMQRKTDIGRYENLAHQFARGESDISGNVATERVRREEMGFREAQARQAEDKDMNQRLLSSIGGASGPIAGLAGMIPFVGPALSAGISGLGSIASGLGTQAQPDNMNTLLQFLQNKAFTKSPVQ